MIPTSDLRKGNLISTEYGILPVYVTSFNDIQVKGKDGRILWAKNTNPVKINSDQLIKIGFSIDEDQNYEMIIGRKGFYVCESQDGDFVLLYRNDIGLNHYPIDFVEYIHELQNIIYWLSRN